MANDGIDEEERIAQEQMNDHAAEIIRGSIRELGLNREIISLDPTASVSDAVAKMISNRLGAVLVVEDGKLLGLFTERDVLTRVAAVSGSESDTPISNVMTSDPECLSFDDGIVFALNKMTVGGFRHIPILNDEGSPAAVLSMRDVVEHIVSFYSDEVFNLPDTPEDIRPSKREGA